MSLRKRLIVLIALVLPLSLLAGGVLTYWQALDKVETEMAAALSLGEATARDVIGTLGTTGDPERQISRLVASFDGERHIRVSLISPTGSAVRSSKPRPPIHPAPDWLGRVLAGPAHASIIALPDQIRSFGSLRVEADPLNEVGEVWEDVQLKLKIIAGFFALVLGLTYWTVGRALRPLEKLASALAEVGQGNFTAHVPESGPKELSAIYREFNRMANRLKEAERQNRALNIQLNTVQEEERSDIARDLHDEIGPFLFAVDVDAQTIPQYLGRGAPDEVIGRAGAIRQSVAHMQSHLRSILNRLRPALLLDLGLAQAIDHLIAFWRQRHSGVQFTAEVKQASFGARLDEIAFRTVQEALNNAVRHGRPARISVRIANEGDGMLHVSVVDDGGGIAPDAAAGFGLAGMRERVTAAGGTLEVAANRDAKGVTVTALLPMALAAPAAVTSEDRRTSVS